MASINYTSGAQLRDARVLAGFEEASSFDAHMGLQPGTIEMLEASATLQSSNVIVQRVCDTLQKSFFITPNAKGGVTKHK